MGDCKEIKFGNRLLLLNGLLAGSLEFFRDNRSNILVWGADRAIPSYFGGTPPTINKGKYILRVMN